jgi:ATP synthase protein I
MADPRTPHDEAFASLDKRLDDLDQTSRREPVRFDEGSGAGYRVVGELIGGVLTGLGFGWLLDRIAGTNPWGLIGGMLIGTGVSIFLVARSAGRMTAPAEKKVGPEAASDSAGKDQNGPD